MITIMSKIIDHKSDLKTRQSTGVSCRTGLKVTKPRRETRTALERDAQRGRGL